MKLNPYLNFNGQCEAAFKFYEHVLGGKIVSKTKSVVHKDVDEYLADVPYPLPN